MKIRRNEIVKPEMEYSTVEFELTNPTNNSVSLNVFDSNTLIDLDTSEDLSLFPKFTGRVLPTLPISQEMACDDTRGYIAISADSSFVIADLRDGSTVAINSSGDMNELKELIYVPQVDKYYAVVKVNEIIQINSTTAVVEGSIDYPAPLVVNGLAFNPVNNSLYFYESNTKNMGYVSVYSFNIASVNTISFAAEIGTVSKVIYSNANNSIYALNGSNRIQVIDCSTNTIVATLTAGIGNPTLGVYNTNDELLYYRDATAATIKILNVNNNTLLGATIPFASAGVTNMVYSSRTNHIWYYDDTNALVRIIDCDSNTIDTNYALNPAVTKGRVAYSGYFNTVYASSGNNAYNFIQELISGQGFYIYGSSDYNQFVRDALISPKKIDRIMIYANSNANLTIPMTINVEDASGQACSEVKLPNNTVATAQYQGQIGQIDFDNFILDVTSNIGYRVPALTTITWVVYYKEIKLPDYLSGKVMIKTFDASPIKDPDTYDEKFLIDTDLKPKWFEAFELKNIIGNESNN